MSADKHIVRVWEASTGKGITSIQPPTQGINDVLLWKDSGLLIVACDAPKIQVWIRCLLRRRGCWLGHARHLSCMAALQAYFLPALGPAPKWCSFLEGLTEELEESATPTIYDDYRYSPPLMPGSA